MKDKKLPPEELYTACHDMLLAVEANATEHEAFFHRMAAALAKYWPESAVRFLIEGDYYVSYAWRARGGKYAGEVKPEAWKLFGERLEIAEDLLGQAWKLDPKLPQIADKMMQVEMGQGKGRERLELWFNRAMELKPDFEEACKRKLLYLEPKWHGSEAALLEFGRACAQAKAGSGKVVLTLVAAHEAVAEYHAVSGRTDYWNRPEVWTDLQTAFEKYFLLNPDAVAQRRNYARYAQRAGRWDVVLQQVPFLGPEDYDYFGGKREFERMVELARSKGAGSGSEKSK
jgi:hypothetical protein